ncbi:MAG: ATP-binding protein [Candidatus Eremiobacterota bacterium]
MARLGCFVGQFNQVLMNLLTNAIDAVNGAGTIRVRTEREQGNFVLRVRDTGPGIPAELNQKVFEPFFTTKPVGSGTGLGLAIAHSIVQAHRGSISVSSQGPGAEVVVTIPLDLEGP